MRVRTLFLVLGAAVLGGGAGWLLGRHPTGESAPPTGAANPRRILFYQSAMHPWIKSDKPGRCTICGMELTPVFEGEGGLNPEPGLVTLSSNAVNALNVRTVDVRRGPLVRILQVAGVILEDQTRHRLLSAYVAGRVEELHVNYLGAEVEAGQPLARFYSPTLLAAERQYLAVLPPLSTDAAMPADAAFLRDAARLRLRQLGLADSQIATLPEKSPTNLYTDLLAPAAGTVVERFVYAGQYVTEGEKLFELADLSTLWFQFDVYEQDLPWVQAGQEVEVTTPSLPGRVFKAPVQFIDPNVDPLTRSTKARVEIANPWVEEAGGRRRLLRNRLYAEGRVRYSAPDVLLIPRSAVLSPSDRPVVYLDREGGAYEPRRVALGRCGDTEYEVLSGVVPGEKLVVRGNLLIDAQAQLQAGQNAWAPSVPPAPSDSPPSPDGHPAATVVPGFREDPAPGEKAVSPLTAEETKAFADFLAAADRFRAALAADDLPGFNAAAQSFPGRVETLSEGLAPDSSWRPVVSRIAANATLAAAADLRVARKSYLPLSGALVALAQRLRTTQAGFRELKVYRCPMTAEAFDAAPPRAEWLQLAPPLRNPWFGAAMLDCGTEVRP